MKPIMIAAALGLLLSGCNTMRTQNVAATAPDAGMVARGLDTAAAAIAVKCATLDDVLVRLTVDSVARAIGNTRRIERLRAERREVCAEAAVRQSAASADAQPDDAVFVP